MVLKHVGIGSLLLLGYELVNVVELLFCDWVVIHQMALYSG